MRKMILGAFVLAAAAVPASSLAAMYAYVNNAGEVMTYDASTPQAAIMSAPNISPRSGVMLLGSDDAEVVGDDVSGV